MAEQTATQDENAGVEWEDDDPRWEQQPNFEKDEPTPVRFIVILDTICTSHRFGHRSCCLCNSSHFLDTIVRLVFVMLPPLLIPFTPLALDFSGEIDNIKSTAVVKLYVFATWSDRRLQGRPADQPLPPRIWSPRLDLWESRPDMDVQTVEFAQRRWERTFQVGDMYVFDKYEGGINNKMDLQMFPFDTDNLELTFWNPTAALLDGTKIVARKSDYRLLTMGDGAGVTGEDDMDIAEWAFVGTSTRYLKSPPGNEDDSRDTFQIRISITRNTQFYVYKVLSPLLLITVLNLLVFWVPIADLADRLAHITTLFLSAFALLYVVAADLPKLKKQTLIDKVIFMTIMMLALTAVHAVVCFHLLETEDPDMIDLADLLNNLAAPVYGGLFVVYLLSQFIPTMLRKRRDLRKIRKYKNKTKEERAKEVQKEQKKKHEANKKADKLRFGDGIKEQNEKIKANLLHDMPQWLIPKSKRVPVLVLVEKDDAARRCVFGHAAALKRGEAAKLTLTAPAKGIAVTQLYPEAKTHDVWTYIELGIGRADQAIEVKFDGTFLFPTTSCLHADCDCCPPAFDICMWQYKVNNHLSLCNGVNDEMTRISEPPGKGGRDFVMNDDGTMSPTAAPQFVLGTMFVSESWGCGGGEPKTAKGPKQKTKRKPGGDSGSGSGDGESKDDRLEVARQRRAAADEQAAAANEKEAEEQQGATEEA